MLLSLDMKLLLHVVVLIIILVTCYVFLQDLKLLRYLALCYTKTNKVVPTLLSEHDHLFECPKVDTNLLSHKVL